MIEHFRAFARATGDVVWQKVGSACQRVVSALQAEFSAGTGLLPNFVQPVSASDHSPRPATPNFLEAPSDGSYGYNAGRDPWRIGVEGLLNPDPTSLAQVRAISAWAEAAAGGDPRKLRAGYALDGAPLPDSAYFTTFFVAPMGVAAIADPAQQRWLNAIYDAVRTASDDYYEESVTLLCLLVMTGAFWDPTVGPV